MYTVTKYKNIKNPKDGFRLSIDKVFEIIKNGDSELTHIKYARRLKKGSKEYDDVKTNLISTFRFNFLFKGKASNKNITDSTGLIFIDVDSNKKINKNEFIFAKWKSLSKNGYGILVKVDGLTIDNFNNAYDEISKLLNINSDIGARKPTQQTVLSYDPKMYINHNSKVYNCANTKKVPSPIKQNLERRGLTSNDTFSNSSEYRKVRFNNINDYFQNKNMDLDYIFFPENKEKICQPFVPITVKEGQRNNTMFTYLTQITALNPWINNNYLSKLADSVNSNAFKPTLQQSEIKNIINNILKLNEEGKLELYLNKERRILFNPNKEFTFKEKMEISNRELGKLRSEKTKDIIYECIEIWDFNTLGKITQKKIADEITPSISTVKRHWEEFKSYVKELNTDFKARGKLDNFENNCSIKYSINFRETPFLKKSA
ncbi:primase C-terminal domain-containing protein [Gaetbulibacter saemankumensis]|uniref:primase C-terminal domain-containing protein n=1 Tax=Gaetbulibacter saemankumensis TaxID=311208 RepID=UPI000423FAED|nr:primase C-terminal domain-containing protein [Gaetbulibacter saemankumensis]